MGRGEKEKMDSNERFQFPGENVPLESPVVVGFRRIVAGVRRIDEAIGMRIPHEPISCGKIIAGLMGAALVSGTRDIRAGVSVSEVCSLAGGTIILGGAVMPLVSAGLIFRGSIDKNGRTLSR